MVKREDVTVQTLEQYWLLLVKVDGFCRGIAERFPAWISCRRGCDSCCTHICVMPVEAVALAMALKRLPVPDADQIRKGAAQVTSNDVCPLLQGGECLLYEARPLICRTHGLPILVEEDGARRVDHCPLNFQGMESLPGDAVLNLETLNTALVTINALFLKELGEAAVDMPERLTIAEALLLEIDPA